MRDKATHDQNKVQLRETYKMRSLRVELLFIMDRCTNCRMPCDGTYCRVCQDLKECQECGRRLSEHLYTQRDDICNTCVRRRQRSIHRTAMNGVVEEREIPTSETDSDVNVFLQQHEDDITQILNEAVNRHG